MSLSKREFLQVLAAASVGGMGLQRYAWADSATADKALYDVPKFGNVSLLHMTDCHAQLKPIYFREPSVNLGIGAMKNQRPHLVGEHLLQACGIRPGTASAHAFSYLDFEAAAKRYLSAVTQKETRAEEEKLIYARVSKEQVEYF